MEEPQDLGINYNNLESAALRYHYICWLILNDLPKLVATVQHCKTYGEFDSALERSMNDNDNPM